jgi:hypothetical protein
MRRIGLLFLVLLPLFGCARLLIDGPVPEGGVTEFANSFDGTAGDLDALFPEDLSGWTSRQLVGNANTISLTDARSKSPSFSFYARAAASDRPVSKADIGKDGLFFREGDEIWLQVAVYVPASPSSVDLYLLDIESTMYSGDPEPALRCGSAEATVGPHEWIRIGVKQRSGRQCGGRSGFCVQRLAIVGAGALRARPSQTARQSPNRMPVYSQACPLPRLLRRGRA